MNRISRLFHSVRSWYSGQLEWGALAPDTPALSGVQVNPDTALGLTAYYAGLNVIATDTACLPLQVLRRRKDGGRDEVRDDPRWELLALSPDGETTAMRWRQALVGHALGRGNGYAEIEPDRRGVPMALHLLDPGTTRADREAETNALRYQLGGTGGGTLAPSRVIHLAGLGFDGLSGYSPIRLFREAIGLGLATQAFGSTFFGNGTHAEGYLKTAKTLKDPARENLRKSINAMHAGPYRSHRFMILEEGMEWVKNSVDPEDAQFLATRQFQVVEMARILRLAPHKIGDFTQAHLANIEASNIDHLQTTIMPWCRAIEQELNRKLFTREERKAGLFVEHDMRAFLRGDAKSRAEYYRQLRDLGVFSPNDICQNENLNPLGPAGDIRVVPLNMVRLEDAGNDPKKVTNGAA